MKKTAIILFISLYLLLSAGLTIETHFCGETITSIEILPVVDEGDSCGCDDMTASNSCCRTEIKSIQLNSEQLFDQVSQQSSRQTDINIWHAKLTGTSLSFDITRVVNPTISPYESPPAHILHRTLLI